MTRGMLVRTKYQKADVFTKALSGSLWPAALSMLGVHDKYEIMRSSSAGLKMKVALSPPVAEPTVTLPGYKNIPARDPKQCWGGKRILHYNMDDDSHDGHDDDDDDDDERKMTRER